MLKDISLENEIWKDCPHYEGLYSVSNLGRVYSHLRGKLIKLVLNNKGYVYIGLRKEGKLHHEQVHRLVALAFIPNPNKKPQVNHKNEIKTDNRVENLEWVTNAENHNYGTRNQRVALALGQPIKCVETNQEYYSIREAGRAVGEKYLRVRNAVNNPNRTAGGYHWQSV